MKQRLKAIAAFFLAAVTALLGFTGCVPDQSEFEYLFDYWCAEWYGWYEITDATGQYAHLKGKKSDCIARSEYTYQCTYAMHVYDTDGEFIFEFEGGYSHEPEKEYGAVGFYCISFDPAYVGDISVTESGLPYDIPVEFTVDGEDHGIEKLAVCKGIVGEGEDTLTMALYLRHWGVRWEDLEEYTGDAFGGKAYPTCLPPSYAAYVAVLEQAELQEQVEAFWHRKRYGWYGWYDVTDATGELAEYAAAKTDCEANIAVDRTFENRFHYNYSINLKILDTVGMDTGRSLMLYGLWEPDEENEVGAIVIERVVGRPAQGRAVAGSRDDPNMVVIWAQVSTEIGDSMNIEVHLRPRDMAWEALKGKNNDDTTKVTGVQQ